MTYVYDRHLNEIMYCQRHKGAAASASGVNIQWATTEYGPGDKTNLHMLDATWTKLRKVRQVLQQDIYQETTCLYVAVQASPALTLGFRH